MTLEWVADDIRRRKQIDEEVSAADAVIHVRMPYWLGLREKGRLIAIKAGREAARAALSQLKRLGLLPAGN